MRSDYELDSQFTGRLRKDFRSPAYIRRSPPLPARQIHDITTASVLRSPTKKANLKRIPAPIPTANQLHPKTKFTVLDRRAVQKPPIIRASKKRKKVFNAQAALYAMAALVFLVGLSVSLLSFRTNQKAQAQVTQISQNPKLQSDGDTTLPSTKKPSAAAVSNYQAPVDLPRYIDIPSIKVHARVYAAATTKQGALAAPNDIFDTVWYKKSSKPGQPGAMLIDGHSGLHADGVFNKLNQLKNNDSIKITRGDGRTYTYLVSKTQLFKANNVDMASLLVSANTSKPGLNLITCAGDPVPGTYDLDHRIAIYSVLR